MSIQVSCPSCKSDVFVDETLAGKDILCPTCQQRMTVPSFAAGRPEVKLSGSEIEESDAGGSAAGAGFPRWREGDDYEVPAQRDPSKWNLTLVGLALMFWTGLVLAIVSVGANLFMLARGSELQKMLGANNPGAPPPPEAMGLLVGMAAFGCVVIIGLIIYFVGMCMCCTVPAASGAKGRAIAGVILFAVTVVGQIVGNMVIGVVLGIQKAQQIQAGQQVRIPAAPVIISSILVGIGMTLAVIVWLLFHKAIAQYFNNGKLARACVWFIVLFIVFTIGNQALQVFATLQNDDVLAIRLDSPVMMIAQLWTLVWMGLLTIYFLLLIRETRRTIREDQVADQDSADQDSADQDAGPDAADPDGGLQRDG